MESSEAAKSLKLKSGDRILITPQNKQVFVTGEVTFPGAFDYMANHPAHDYAGLAGITELARSIDEIYVIRAKSGKVERGRNIIVDIGDIIVVPRKRRETVRDYLTILTPILSLGISVYAIISRN